MTLVTGTAEDIGLTPDNSLWMFSSPLRESSDGEGLITPKWARRYPVEGVVSVELDPGPAIINYRGIDYHIEVPESSTAKIKDLIAAEIAFPTGTPPQLVGNAVDAYLDVNPVDWDVLNKPPVIAEGDTQAEARAAISVPQLPNATAVKTSAYNAVAGDLVTADASSGAFTVTLPSAPAAGTVVVAKKVDSSANAVTIQRSGSDVFNTAGGGTTLQLLLQDQTVSLQYKTGIWYVTGHGASPAALDARYVSVDNSTFVTLTGTQTLTNKTLTNPKINSINESSFGLRALAVGAASSAVNYIQVFANPTGTGPQIYASGTDTDINLNLMPRGTGRVQSAGVNIPTTTSTDTLTNKTLTSPTLTTPFVSTTMELGHASDTTLSRSAAGMLAVEGVDVVNVSATQTLTNKTLTNPKVNSLLDATNGLRTIALSSSASAVNYMQFNANAVGSSPQIYALGTDTNIGVDVVLKGTGRLRASGVNVPTISSADTLTNKALTSPTLTSGNAPATAASTGVVGQVEWDSGFLYVCTAANTWKRAAVATW